VNKHRTELLSIAALLMLGSLAFLRLMVLPVFEDEGTQLRWIWRAIEAGEWLQPLGDGKPLEAWPMVPLVRVGLPSLLAARATHVLAGMLAAVLTYRLALESGGRAAALASGVLMAICPFLVYLQRLALSDVFMCAAGIWVLLSVARFVQMPTKIRAMNFACSLVVAAFCKFPVAFVFLMTMPLALLLMPPEARRRMLRPPVSTRLLAAHAPVALLLAGVIGVAVLRESRGLAPGFGLQDFTGIGLGGYSEIAKAIGIAPPDLLTELTVQLSWPVTVMGCIGLLGSVIAGDWRRRWLVAAGLVPLLAIGTLASFWFSRYLLFTLPPLVIAAVSGWRDLGLRAGRFHRFAQFGALAICAVLMGQQSARIILNPLAARWSPLDRFQYFEGWTSGYGYPEAAQFLLRTADAPAAVYSLDGHSAYQLLAYLPSEWRGRVKPVIYGPDGGELRSENARFENLLGHTPAWIVIDESLLAGYLDSSFGPINRARIDLRQIAVFDKPGRRTRLGLYEITLRAPCQAASF
jgi:4-amino-4-deoxy-L-arabinose transferase-like glycosyltransferase